MKRTAAYRFTSDICFYFSVLSIFPSMLPLQKPMALFAAASLVVSLIALYCPWAPLRFLLALLPGLAFIGAKLGFPILFPALAWLYLILVLTAGRFHIWLESYRRSFRAMMLICFFVLFSAVMLNTIKPGVTVFLPGLLYTAVFLYLGMFALRRLQMNAPMGLRWNLANGAAVVGVPLLAVGCSLLLWWLLNKLQPVFRYLLKQFLVFLVWLINTIFPIRPDEPMPSPSPSPTLTPEEAAVVEPGWVTPTPEVKFGWEPDPALLEKAARISVGVLLAFLLLALVLLLVNRARRNRAKADEDDFYYEETEEGMHSRRRRKAERVFSAAAPSMQIRILYRQYMKLMRKRGVIIRKDSTSREILVEAEQIHSSPDAQRLRELYLKARYGDGSLVSREDVEEAFLCLQKILIDKVRDNDASPPQGSGPGSSPPG